MCWLKPCLLVVAACLTVPCNGIRIRLANTDNGHFLDSRNDALLNLGGTLDNDYPVRNNNFNDANRVRADSLDYLVQTVDRHNPDTLREVKQRVHHMLNNQPLQDRQTRNLEQKLYKVRLIGEEVNHHDWMNLRYNGEPNRFVQDMAKYL